MKRSHAKILAWVAEKGRVTAADLAIRSDFPIRKAAKILFELEAAGRLVREGGGPHDSFWWRKP